VGARVVSPHRPLSRRKATSSIEPIFMSHRPTSRSTHASNRPESWADRLASIDGEELAQIYEQLRAHARRLLADERRGHTLQATALVNEALCKLLSESGAPPSSSSTRSSLPEIFGALALRMRQVLVEHARRRNALKGGGRWTRTRLHDAAEKVERDGIDLPELDRVLARFEREDPEAAAAFQLRWFAGMSIEQLAIALGVTEQVAQTRWQRARRRLMALLPDPEESS